jgi:hypothetical protein
MKRWADEISLDECDLKQVSAAIDGFSCADSKPPFLKQGCSAYRVRLTRINRPNLFEPKSQRKRSTIKQFGRLISV